MKRGILSKVLFPVLLVLILVTGASCYLSYSIPRDAVEDSLRAELGAVSTLLARNMTTLMHTAEVELGEFMARDVIQNALLNPSPDSTIAAKGRMEDFIERFSLYDALLITNPQGKVLLASNPSGVGLDLSDRDYFKLAAQGRTTFSYPVVSRMTNVPVVSIAVPIKNGSHLQAVAIASISLNTLSKRMIEGVTIGNTGYAYIIAGNGVVVAHPDPAQINTLQLNDHDWGKKIMAMDDGFVTYMFNGSERTAAAKLEPLSGMRVATVMQSSEFGERVQGVLKGSIVALFGILVLVTLVLFVIVRSIISKPLQKLSTAADQVANGNLNVNLAGMANDFAGKGEITTTYQSISAMLVSLKDNIELAEQKTADAARQTELAKQATAEAEQARQQAERARSEGMQAAASELEGAIAVISSASEQLSVQVEHSGQGADEQADRVGNTAAAMEEMNATVMEVAKSASIAENISRNTKNKAQEGAEMVHDVVESIHDVQSQSLALKGDMETLVDLAQSIDQIMRVISDIADQTNLLALNAAIEAARAGEAGRGFAVVADEVRKLAEKTMTSTGDVGSAIKSIQVATNKNMSQVDEAVRTIEAVTELADKSGIVLKEIVGLADQTADHIHSIATASEEQSSTSDEISRSISQVSVIATQTSAAMREAGQAVGDLASQALNLQTLVSNMKKS